MRIVSIMIIGCFFFSEIRIEKYKILKLFSINKFLSFKN